MIAIESLVTLKGDETGRNWQVKEVWAQTYLIASPDGTEQHVPHSYVQLVRHVTVKGD